MKKDYLKPAISIESVEFKDICVLDTSAPVTDETVDPASKERENFEGEGDSGWGALW